MRNRVNMLLTPYRSKKFATALLTCVSCCALTSTAMAYTESEDNPGYSSYSIEHSRLLADARFDDRDFNRPRPSDRQRDPRSGPSRDQRGRDHDDEHRAAAQHREQYQPRFQRNRPDEAPYRKHDERDQRFRREYSTEDYRHPHYPRYNPPPVFYPKHYHPRERVLVRPFRYAVPYRDHHRHDVNIWGLLTFTALTLAILDNLNDQQQREHELALYNATTTPLGETIHWQEGNASGAVTTTREGTSSSGRYCREYLSEVTIGGKRESVYGTACQQPDGSWEIVE